MNKKNTTRGGPREWAGRKPTGRTVTTSSISLAPELWDRLDALRGELTRSAWIAAMIDNAQKNPPQGKIRMYCAGWRDRNIIGWGDYYLDSIHPTPEAAAAAVESLRVKHKWGECRATSCGQCVDVFFPANA
jgi:hypothetical protein